MKKYILFLIIFLFFGILSAETPDKWNNVKSTHFIVYYKNAKQEFIDLLVNKSEDYYNRIADDLGFRRFDFWLWDNRAKIYIYDNADDYQSATNKPSWSGGCTEIGTKTIYTYPYAKNFFEMLLPHEMGHIIFREFVGFDNYAVPLWLDEGVASYQEKSRYSLANAVINKAIAEGSFLGIDKLSGFNDLFGVRDQKIVQLFYTESFGIVDFLIKEFGRGSFVLFCQNLRDKKDFRRALASTYPFSNTGELEEAWQKHLK